MDTRRDRAWRYSLGMATALFLFSFWAYGAQSHLVRAGKAECVIVVDPNAGEFYRLVGQEIQHYVAALTGASPSLVSPEQVSGLERQQVLILVGGPGENTWVKEAVAAKLANFDGLKKDGFLLRTVQLKGHPALIVGGNDEASTMYAAYDLVERYGAVFLVTKEILPARRADLDLLKLDVRAETPFPRRGLFISNIYPNRGIMHLAEVKKLLDQMAKMKMNFLQFFWFEHEPWINFDYRGEGKLVGDATGKETGYLTWRYHYGSYLTRDLEVGRELFKDRPRMAPTEFQEVENPADAFRVSKNFLTEIIRYAKTKKIKVWLCVDPTTLPGNLARYARRAPNLSIPFHPILATHMCPGDPALHEMNENRLKALVTTYPEAEGYFFYVPEAYPKCPDPQDQSLLASERPKYEGLLKLWEPYTRYERDPASVLDSIAGSSYIVRKVIEARDRIAPYAKVGIGGLGHGYVLPYLDKMVPKNVPFTDMESRGIWTPAGVPMKYFGGMGERERTVIPRIDDDSDMFGMQFNVTLYYKDQVLEGSLENGVAGFAGQMNRARGTEQNTRYLAEGAWQPHLTPEEFYDGYARRIFGESAQKEMVAAFKVLEENEEYLGWTGQGNFGCCGVIGEVAAAYRLYKQPNPFDGPTDWKFVNQSEEKIKYFTRSVELLKKALGYFDEAGPKVGPQGREELNYLRNKTESYVMLLETLVAARKGYMGMEEAFRLWTGKAIDRAELVRRLDASMGLFTEARRMGRRTTEKFAEVVDHPSDLGVLYRANLFLVTGLELVEQTMRNIVNFHQGREYTTPVAWDKIYREFPQFAPAR